MFELKDFFRILKLQFNFYNEHFHFPFIIWHFRKDNFYGEKTATSNAVTLKQGDGDDIEKPML